ncbi:MAG: DNA polymerase III subunit delta [Candidatus Desulforudis sp.]|nr:DNA polymerase III subunit delta [Desulforudis sp.]
MQYYREFAQDVEQGRIAPVYLFYGEEVFLHHRAIDRLKAALLPEGIEAFNLSELDGEEAGPDEVVGAARLAPVLSVYRLVVVRNVPWFDKSPTEIQSLEIYLEKPLNSTCLVLQTAGTVDRRRKLYQLAARAGRAIDFTLLSRDDTARWVSREAKRAGKVFTREAMEHFLAARPAGLQGVATELEKLLTFVGAAERITGNDVLAVAPPLRQETIFQVVDAVGERRFEVALDGIRKLLAAGEPPFGILAMLARQFRLLLCASDLADSGLGTAEIAARLKTRPFVIKKALAQARNFQRQQLAAALAGLLEVDAAVKTGRQDFYPALNNFFLFFRDS